MNTRDPQRQREIWLLVFIIVSMTIVLIVQLSS